MHICVRYVSKRKALTELYVSYHFHYGQLNYLGVFILLGGAMMCAYYISRSGTFLPDIHFTCVDVDVGYLLHMSKEMNFWVSTGCC